VRSSGAVSPATSPDPTISSNALAFSAERTVEATAANGKSGRVTSSTVPIARKTSSARRKLSRTSGWASFSPSLSTASFQGRPGASEGTYR